MIEGSEEVVEWGRWDDSPDWHTLLECTLMLDITPLPDSSIAYYLELDDELFMRNLVRTNS
jgi:hypothetical protein